MNIQKIKQILCLQLKYLKIHLAVLVGTFAAAMLLVYVIVQVTHSEDYGRLGIMLSMVSFYTLSLIVLTYALLKDYTSYVKNSITRRNILVGIYSYHTLTLAIGTGMLLLLFQIEYHLTRWLYPTLPAEELVESLFTVYGYLLPVIVAIVIVTATIFAGVSHQYGTKGFLIIYFTSLIALFLLNSNIAQAVSHKIGLTSVVVTMFSTYGVLSTAIGGIIITLLLYLSVRSTYKADVS